MKQLEMEQLETSVPNWQPLLLVGIVAALGLLIIDAVRIPSSQETHQQSETCDGQIHPEVNLSREQLAQLLTISERDSKARVQEVLPAPYCQLPALEVRAGVMAERAVYPLAFDPQTWLVVLYEGEEYAGYQFLFQH